MAKAETRRLVIKQTCAVHGEHCDVGEVIDVDDDMARELINIGRAAPAEAGAKVGKAKPAKELAV